MANETATSSSRRQRSRSALAGFQLSRATQEYIDEQLAVARADIVWRLAEIAEADESVGSTGEAPAAPKEPASFTADDLARAFQTIELGGPREKPTRAAVFFAWFPPFTCVCAGLCLLFAILGLFASSDRAAAGVAKNASGFLDVAKIFAGAIVGSTSTSIAGQVKRRRTASRVP